MTLSLILPPLGLVITSLSKFVLLPLERTGIFQLGRLLGAHANPRALQVSSLSLTSPWSARKSRVLDVEEAALASQLHTTHEASR